MKAVFLWAALLALAAAALVLFWHFGKKPYKHRRVSQSEIVTYLQELLKRGFNGGFLVISIPGSPLFLQFSKYIAAKGDVGIQMDFPSVSWSRDYLEPLRRELSQKGLEFELEQGSDGTEFVTVDFRKDVSKAAAVGERILQTVFGLSADRTVTLHFENVSIRDETIGL